MRSTGSGVRPSARRVRALLTAIILALLVMSSSVSVFAEDGAAGGITPAEAEALTGVDESKLQVVWSTEYFAENYPLTLKINLSGLDGLPVYVFERIDGVWTLLTVGTAPDVGIPVEKGGLFSAVTTTVGSNYPAKDTTRKAPSTGDSVWLLATAGVTAAGAAFALVFSQKRTK